MADEKTHINGFVRRTILRTSLAHSDEEVE